MDGRRRASHDFSRHRRASSTGSDFTADMLWSDLQADDTTLEGSNMEGNDFTGDDLHFLQVFASQAATAIAASGALIADRERAATQPSTTPSSIAPEADECVDIPKDPSQDSKESQEACCQIDFAIVTAEGLGQAADAQPLLGGVEANSTLRFQLDRAVTMGIADAAEAIAEQNRIASPCSQRSGRRSGRARQRAKKFR